MTTATNDQTNQTTGKKRRAVHAPEPKFTLNKDMSIAERIADFLNWGADTSPGKFWPWNIIAYNCLGLPRIPRNGTDAVGLIHRAAPRAYRMLENRFGRLYYPLKGYGVRACFDTDDAAKNGIRTSVKRGRSAISAIRRQASLIDEREISNSVDMRPYKDFITNQLKPSLRSLATLEARLSLPPLVEADDDK